MIVIGTQCQQCIARVVNNTDVGQHGRHASLNIALDDSKMDKIGRKYHGKKTKNIARQIVHCEACTQTSKTVLNLVLTVNDIQTKTEKKRTTTTHVWLPQQAPLLF